MCGADLAEAAVLVPANENWTVCVHGYSVEIGLWSWARIGLLIQTLAEQSYAVEHH